LPSIATATALDPQKVTVSQRPTSLFVSKEKRTVLLCLGLVMFTLAFYNPVVHNGFTNMDDDGYITDNSHVQDGLTWATVKWAFTSVELANWHPVTWLSHALDCQLFKLNPVGHHYVDVLFHAVNALLLFLLLESATELTWPSFMVAALFALHPVNVESVAWASERKNVLSMFFFLLTMHGYQWYVRHPNIKKYSAVVVLFALGLMAKPEIITLPFVLLLWDYWPLQRMGAGISSDHPPVVSPPRSFSYLLREKIPLFVLSAASAVITLIAQKGGNAVRNASTRVRFGNAVVAYMRYIGKAFWPTHLAAMYPHLGRFLPAWQIVASATMLLLVTTAVLRFRSHRYLAVGWFWFLGTLVPVIGLVQVGVQAMADRYAYLSFIGLFVAVIWTIQEIAQRRKIQPAWLAVPAVVVLGTFGMLTHKQISYWHDSVSLWKHTLDVTERNYFAHNAYAYALAQTGQVDAAIAEFNAAEALHTYNSLDMSAVAAYERAHGHIQEALAEYGRALDAAGDPKSRSIVLSRLSSVFLQLGDLTRARLTCDEALKQNSNNGSALVGCGLLAEHEGDVKTAIAQISQGMKVEPTDVGYLLLAHALGQSGDTDGAKAAALQAQQLSQHVAKGNLQSTLRFSMAQQEATEILATSGIPKN
jgi:protein O-mannosyl-transferase